MTIDLTEKEAEAYLKDLQGTLAKLVDQKKDLLACISFLQEQSGDENGNRDETETRIKGLEFDISVTQELVKKHEQDIRDLEDAHIT